MKHFVLALSVAAFGASAAVAQTTTQVGAVSSTDDAAYPVAVTGANGVDYKCRAELITTDGRTARLCVPLGTQGTAAGATGGLLAAGAGIGTAGAVALGALAVVAVASVANDDDDADSTTTTLAE